ncbi:MAG TPA: type II toxin-antitoxin system prevent-host-death family antitoxin [Mycobacteriales bacterium]|nr:type II toxin-antitoxin system prevent-host-death family antitoxin [Mycobacteriales bacterium]
MSRYVSQRELRNDSGEILRAVAGGETLIITRNGTPLAELRPLRRRTFVPRAELAVAAVHAPVLDSASFRAEVDDVLDQTPLGD